MSPNLIKLMVGALVVGVAFSILWWKGYIAQLADYVQQTKQELLKCTWPTWDELKGSTVLVFVSILLLGAFIIAADYVFVNVMSFIMRTA